MVPCVVCVDLRIEALSAVVGNPIEVLVDYHQSPLDPCDNTFALPTEYLPDWLVVGGEAVMDNSVYPPRDARPRPSEQLRRGLPIAGIRDKAREHPPKM